MVMGGLLRFFSSVNAPAGKRLTGANFEAFLKSVHKTMRVVWVRKVAAAQ
jgi:hypothetical protein